MENQRVLFVTKRWSSRISFFPAMIFFCSWFLIQSGYADALDSELDSLFSSHSYSVWSVQVKDLENGQNLYNLTPDRKLIPASNMKVVVCSAALLRLGPDFKYQTILYKTGKLEGSVWKGDLLVEGSGDPSMDGRFVNGDLTAPLRQWAATLKSQGIQSVEGRVIGVDDGFDDVRHGLNWNPDNFVDWYSAEVSALTLNDACVDVTIQGGAKVGEPATISLNPPTQYLNILDNVRTVASAGQEGIAIRRNGDDPTLNVLGGMRVKRSGQHPAAIPNPTLYFATVLKETLEKEGIQIHGDALDGDDTTLPDRKLWEKVDVYESPRLIQLIETCIKNSQNLYAEHFIKTLGMTEYGNGSWETGALAVKDIFFDQDNDLDDMYIADGSGLSRENRVSANDLVKILQIMADSPYSQLFMDTLPQAGIDGTLKARMRGSDAYKRVFAKTGTLNGVRALSGYIKAKSGKTYLFSMLGNATRSAISLSAVMDEACSLIAAE